MAYNLKYPHTNVSTLSEKEARKLLDGVLLSKPEKFPLSSKWIYFSISLAIILALILGGLYAIQ